MLGVNFALSVYMRTETGNKSPLNMLKTGSVPTVNTVYRVCKTNEPSSMEHGLTKTGENEYSCTLDPLDSYLVL